MFYHNFQNESELLNACASMELGSMLVAIKRKANRMEPYIEVMHVTKKSQKIPNSYFVCPPVLFAFDPLRRIKRI